MSICISRCLPQRVLWGAGRFVALALCAGAVLGVGAGRADTGPKADAAKQLSPEVRIGVYGIRPPLGFNAGTRQRGSATVYYWAGPAHPNGTVPVICVTIATIPLDQAKVSTLDLGVASRQLIQRKSEQDATFTNTEVGHISGIAMARYSWAGHDKDSLMTHGMSYFATDGRTLILIDAQDIEPYSSDTLPLMETGILTFRRVAGR